MTSWTQLLSWQIVVQASGGCFSVIKWKMITHAFMNRCRLIYLHWPLAQICHMHAHANALYTCMLAHTHTLTHIYSYHACMRTRTHTHIDTNTSCSIGLLHMLFGVLFFGDVFSRFSFSSPYQPPQFHHFHEFCICFSSVNVREFIIGQTSG